MKWMCLWLWLGCAAVALAEEHPRLLFPRLMEAGVKHRIATDPLAGGIQDLVVKRAEQVLGERTCEYRIPDGKRLLSESRLALHHVLHCGWAWRTTGEVRFKDRVIRELDAACALKNWNPAHFLDTAEMATAVAIGYDWLFPGLSDVEKKRYEDALLEKALRVVGEKHAKSGWWKGATNNWTQVCGTGMALAAEAVKERDPELCAELVEHGADLIGKSARFYQPDGAYPEGPSYWHYGTNYHVLLLAARETLKQEIEVPEVLRGSGDFMRHVTGPSRLSFNYADGNAFTEIPSPAQSWIATHFKDAGQARHVRGLLERSLNDKGDTTGDMRFFPLHLLWLPEDPKGNDQPGLAARFNGEQSFAFFRTSWQPDAAWFAIKGGTGGASHGHLDAGAFVYEAKGVRWFHDLGKDDYNMPGYFGKQRWDYLRLTNLSHNTLVIDGKLQATPDTGCPVTHGPAAVDEPATMRAYPDLPRLITAVDLTPAYAGQAGKVTRTALFDPGDGTVILGDVVEKPVGAVRWAIVTKAKATIEGPLLILEEDGKRLVVSRVFPLDAAWEEYSLKPATKREQQNQGFHLIGFTTAPAEKVIVEVRWKAE